MEWNELKVGMKVVPMKHLKRNIDESTTVLMQEKGYLKIKDFTSSFDGEPTICLEDNNFYQPEELRPFTGFEPELVTLNLDTPEKMALFLSLFNSENIVEDLDRKQGGKIFSVPALRKAFVNLVPFDKWVEISNKLRKIT